MGIRVRVATFNCILAMIAWLPTLGLAQTDELTFVGRFGDKELVLQFFSPNELKSRESYSDDKNVALAQYFDRSDGKVMSLVKADDGWLIECKARFESNDCSNPTGYWRVLKSPSAGHTNSVSVQRKLSLADTPVTINFTPSQLKPLEYFSVWEQLLGQGKTSLIKLPKRNGVVTAVLKDDRSGVRVPQVISGYQTDVMTRFNSEQAVSLARKAASRLENQSLGGEEDDSYDIQYQSPKFLVWGGGTGGYFGGVHGLYTYDIQTYDMKTGSRSKTKNVFLKYYIDDLIVAETQKARNLAAKYAAANPAIGADECFSTWLEKLQLSEDDRDILTPGEKYLVDHSMFTESDRISLMPQHDGLAIVSNDFPEVERQCRGIQLLIPWKKVRPYLNQAM